MKPDCKTLALKMIIYIVLSYAMALLSILVIVLMPTETEGTVVERNIFNILFSTNACFISTTGWSIKKDRHLLDEDSNHSDLVYLSVIVGLLISAVMVVLSYAANYYSRKAYLGGLGLTLLSCAYLAYVYIREIIQKDQIVRQHDEAQIIERAQEMIKVKEETSVRISGSEYKL